LGKSKPTWASNKPYSDWGRDGKSVELPLRLGEVVERAPDWPRPKLVSTCRSLCTVVVSAGTAACRLTDDGTNRRRSLSSAGTGE
jgi:hypothetical protein